MRRKSGEQKVDGAVPQGKAGGATAGGGMGSEKDLKGNRLAGQPQNKRCENT